MLIYSRLGTLKGIFEVFKALRMQMFTELQKNLANNSFEIREPNRKVLDLFDQSWFE